jgi:small-conductance mechanosensitive channel
VFLVLWDALNGHGIEIPMPQREVHIRELVSPTQPRAREAQSAQD